MPLKNTEDQQPQADLFFTRDLYLATTLLTLKIPLVGIDYQFEGLREMPVGYFQFENTDELKEIEQQFWQGLLLVEPRMFVNNMRALKAKTSNVYKNPHQAQKDN